MEDCSAQLLGENTVGGCCTVAPSTLLHMAVLGHTYSDLGLGMQEGFHGHRGWVDCNKVLQDYFRKSIEKRNTYKISPDPYSRLFVFLFFEKGNHEL